MMVQRSRLQGFGSGLVLVAAILGVVPVADGQALHVTRLGNGTELVLVAQPLSNATTVAWPAVDSAEAGETGLVISGELTLAADLDAALSGEDPAPAVVIAVGGVSAADLRAHIGRLLEGRRPRETLKRPRVNLVDGSLIRRLGSPGSEAEIRLEVDLPAPSDPLRSTVEVLWELLPDVFSEDIEGLRSRIDGERGVLESRSDPELADLTVRRLRLGLARIATDSRLQAAQVDSASMRLQVRRKALLEQVPEGAEHLLELWRLGGVEAIAEFLFAGEGVTLDGVRDAAQRWLPRHPGRIVIVLPPRTFNPRFAAPPEAIHLENGLAAVILDRPGAELAAVSLRPVMVPDVEGELSATILARLAGELRAGEERPGWVRVNVRPPLLEVAAPADDFGELSELLHAALVRMADDTRSVEGDGGGARRRALALMGGILGLSGGAALSPAELLRPGNIALGVVAGDGEAAAEALRKFWIGGGERRADAAGLQVAPIPRTRVAAAGDESVLVVALELDSTGDEAFALVMADLFARRAENLVPEGSAEILAPFVPGRQVLLLVATAASQVDELGDVLRERWEEFTRPTTEEELVEIRRRAAAVSAAAWSGVVGRSRRCAAIAAGAAVWRAPSDLEMQILLVSAEPVSAGLGKLADWASLETTGAGLLPILDFDDP
ncbi:MAG: hypothetical protein ACC742_00090 [Thermoanaerobaculales bacterium]